ncbi:hypothetical protein ACFLQZ_01535 [Acidobacteriota bacterium]
MKFNDTNVKQIYESHPEVDMSNLAYIYAYQDRASGVFGWIKMKYYFISWDTHKLHLIETTLSGKEKIFRSLDLSDIESVEVKNRVINKLVNLKIKGEDILRLNCGNKVMGLKNQKEHLETILNVLNQSA